MYLNPRKVLRISVLYYKYYLRNSQNSIFLELYYKTINKLIWNKDKINFIIYFIVTWNLFLELWQNVNFNVSLITLFLVQA